jgi:hypothetical protein
MAVVPAVLIRQTAGHGAVPMPYGSDREFRVRDRKLPEVAAIARDVAGDQFMRSG